MPDDCKGGGWRKRLHAPEKRPRTPLSVKVDESEIPGSHNSEQLEEEVGKAYTGPTQNLAIAIPLMIACKVDERNSLDNDATTEILSPRRRSAPMPRLKRMFSEIFPSKTDIKSSEVFSKPWAEEMQFVNEPPVDPLVIIQTVYSHITTHAWKNIPAENNSGILRVFEDYRKIREREESLRGQVSDMIEKYRRAEQLWFEEEDRYHEEIRRLELMMARGATGMSELMKARQGTLVCRKRRHKRIVSASHIEFNFLTTEHVDGQFESECQKGVMTALSQQLVNGIPQPDMPEKIQQEKNSRGALSRKIKSEIHLINVSNMAMLEQGSGSFPSESYRYENHLREKKPADSVQVMDPGVVCHSFGALKELAVLVARRRGIDIEEFTSRLFDLYSSFDESKDTVEEIASVEKVKNPQAHAMGGKKVYGDLDLGKRRPQHINSQPHLQGQRRHFSFEPGDDQLGGLDDRFGSFAFVRPKSPAGSQSTCWSDTNEYASSPVRSSVENPAFTTSMLAVGPVRRSKIPSPVQRPSLSRVRRDDSASNARIAFNRTLHDSPRGSNASAPISSPGSPIGGVSREQCSLRSKSVDSICRTESRTRTQSASLRPRASLAAIAAVRAVDGTRQGRGGKKIQAAKSVRVHGVPREGQVSESHVLPQERL